MCAICNQIPCHSRCPNAPEAQPVFICTKCGEDILEGDKFFDSPAGPVCKDCMDDMTTDEVLDLLGEMYSTVEMEDMYGL